MCPNFRISATPYHILVKTTEQKRMTLIISMASVNGSEGTSSGSFGDQGLSVIILTTSHGSDRNLGTCLCLVSFILGCPNFDGTILDTCSHF